MGPPWRAELREERGGRREFKHPNGSLGVWTHLVSSRFPPLRAYPPRACVWTRVLSRPPPAFQEVSSTVYAKEGEQMNFSFPLTFGDENLSGELSWLQAKGNCSPESWITFKLNNGKVTVGKARKDLKLHMSKGLPLRLTLPQALPQYAGSGNLTLNLTKGKLYQEVNLVVMRGEEIG